jgi:hypothetical protein
MPPSTILVLGNARPQATTEAEGPPPATRPTRLETRPTTPEDQGRTCTQPCATAPTSLSLSTEPNDQRLARSRARDPECERVRGERDAQSTEFLWPKCSRGWDSQPKVGDAGLGLIRDSPNDSPAALTSDSRPRLSMDNESSSASFRDWPSLRLSCLAKTQEWTMTRS